MVCIPHNAAQAVKSTAQALQDGSSIQTSNLLAQLRWLSNIASVFFHKTRGREGDSSAAEGETKRASIEGRQSFAGLLLPFPSVAQCIYKSLPLT